MINTKEKESRRLRSAKKHLEGIGFYVVLSRASLGPFDLVAMNSNGVLFIQVKCNSWPDEAEEETIRLFDKAPRPYIKQVWRFDDHKVNPQVKTY